MSLIERREEARVFREDEEKGVLTQWGEVYERRRAIKFEWGTGTQLETLVYRSPETISLRLTWAAWICSPLKAHHYVYCFSSHHLPIKTKIEDGEKKNNRPHSNGNLNKHLAKLALVLNKFFFHWSVFFLEN